MIVNIISSVKGGGAEVIVNELHKIYLNKKLDSRVIYFSGAPEELKKNQYFLGMNPRNPFIIFKLRSILRKLASQSKNELIIHAHLTWPFFYTVLAVSGLKKIKLFYTEHATENRRRKIIFFWIIERFFYKRFLSIVCISQGAYENLFKWVGYKISQRLLVIPNGSRIYSVTNRPAIKNRLPRLISIGSLIRIKNFSTTILAVSNLKNVIENYIIIGEGPEEIKLKNLIKSKQLEEKVKLIGWSDTIEKHLHSADILLIPSLEEGFGLVAVEGMSTGLAIVASNVVGLKEVFGNPNPSVILVDEIESVERWTEAINKTIQNIICLGQEAIAKSSEKQAKNFTFEKMAENYLSIYLKNN
jgi:glycosyltransferase involved in cell wall biosynthesis